MSDWTDEVRARLVREEERLRYKAANLQARGKTVMAAQELVVAADIRAALGEIERQKEKLQEWSDWEAMLHTQLERVVGGSGRGCDSLVETLRLRLLACEKEIDRKDNGYAAIIKMERDARDQFRERAEAAEADRDEWRETAARRMLGRRAAEAELAEALASETALEAEVKRLTALLDVSERKLGEWRDRGAEVQRLRAVLERVLTEAGIQTHKHGCPNRLIHKAQWDEHKPCAGCEAEYALLRGGGE